MATDSILGDATEEGGISLPRHAVAPTLGIALAEAVVYLTVLGTPALADVALGLHLLVFLGCLVGAAFTDVPWLYRAFALVPLFRLVNLGLPTLFELTLANFPVVYAPFLLAALWVVHTTPELEVHVGLRQAAVFGLPALAVAAVLGWVEFRLITPEALIPAGTAVWLAALVVVMVGFVGLGEELLFRGLIQGAVRREAGALVGILVGGLLFGAMHSIYGSPVEIVFAATVGVLFGIAYEYTDSLVLVAVAHGTLNVFLFGVIPLAGGSLFGVL